MKATTGRLLIGIAGLTLLVGFFLPWVDVGGMGFRMQASGYFAVRSSHAFGMIEAVMLAVPLGGIAMMVAAFKSARAARIVSLSCGLGLAGYSAYKIVSTFFAVTGWGLWLVIAAGAFAMVGPLLMARERR